MCLVGYDFLFVDIVLFFRNGIREGIRFFLISFCELGMSSMFRFLGCKVILVGFVC